VGLIVYGMFIRQWSLRDLEGLARRDVGAWWMCGGQQPDHSTIGKFIGLHKEWLSDEFFTTVVKHLVGKLKLKLVRSLATGRWWRRPAVICGRCGPRPRRRRRKPRRPPPRRTPEDADLQAQAAAAAEVERVAAQRVGERQAHGGKQEAVLIVAQELEAVVQRGKDGRNRPSYKPSVLRHHSQLIVAQHVDPSREIASLEPMLDQHQQVFGAPPLRLLLDAGYFSLGVLELAVARDLDLLCPSGKRGQPRRSPQRHFGKGDFHYLSERDVFHCPSGRELSYLDTARDYKGRRYRRYRGRQCTDCPLRTDCTQSPEGRTVRRYDGDDLKEAMGQVLRQAAARRAYRQRAELAERTYAEQRERQGLRRFHRRGLSGARVEFSLHCVAFNLKLVARGRLGLQLHTLTFCYLIRPGQPLTFAAMLWCLTPLS
jgi:hypothetical protein